MIINMNGAKAPETPSPVLQEKTVTPETLPTVIGADEGYGGLSQVTVNPDANLKPTNIRSGKTIFGVDGTFEGAVMPSELAKQLINKSVKTITADDAVGKGNYGIGSYAFYQCRSLTSAEIYTESIFGVGNHAFDDCQALTSVTFLNGCQLIGDSAFKSTTNLTHIDIPDDCQNIGAEAFRDSGITSLDTKNVTFLGLNCIDLARSLTTMTTKATNISRLGRIFLTELRLLTSTPPMLSNSVLYESLKSSGLRIIVPKGSLEAYQTSSYWSQYASMIEEASE